MGLMIEFPEGPTITLEQLITLSVIKQTYSTMRWHMNRCGCCVLVHTEDGHFLIGQDGEFDFTSKGE